MSQKTVSLPVCLGINHPSWAHDQILITVRELRVCLCEASSLTRGLVCNLQLLLGLASAMVLGSDFGRTNDRILTASLRLLKTFDTTEHKLHFRLTYGKYLINTAEKAISEMSSWFPIFLFRLKIVILLFRYTILWVVITMKFQKVCISYFSVDNYSWFMDRGWF
jgi:hypothetical protein